MGGGAVMLSGATIGAIAGTYALETLVGGVVGGVLGGVIGVVTGATGCGVGGAIIGKCVKKHKYSFNVSAADIFRQLSDNFTVDGKVYATVKIYE